MKLRPLNDNLIIEQDGDDYVDANPEISRILKESKLVLPQKNSVLKSSMTGNIVSWGSRCHYVYKVGQRIVFARFGGQNFLHQGKKYRMIKEWEILATYESE